MDDYKLANVAAAWWIEEMKKRCNDLYPHKIIETDCCLNIVDDSFAKELARFETVLTNEILHCIQLRSSLSLTCYFLPSRELSKLIKKAQISTECLPTRATMHICGKSVEVSLNGESMRKLPLPAK